MATIPQIATDKLLQQIDDLVAAVVKITQDPTASTEQAQALIFRLLKEARVSLEALRLIDDELHQQNEALILSRNTIEKQRHHYHDLFDRAPVGYLLTDSEGIIREHNQAALTLLNAGLNHLVGKPLAIFVPEAHRGAFGTWLIESNSCDTVRVWETHLQPRHTSEPRDIMLTIAPLKADETQPDIHFSWLLYDITDRKKAEAAEREQYFYDTFERSAVGIAHTNSSGKYLRVNQKLCDMLGYSRGELLGMTAFDVTTDDDMQQSQHVLHQLTHKEIDSISLEKRYRHRDGTPIWVQVTASAVYEQNQYAYTISVLNDITDSKRLKIAEAEQRALTEAVRKTAAVITSTLNFEEVLDHIVETIGMIVPYDGASILLAEVDPMDAHVERGWGNIAEIIPRFEKFLVKLRLPGTPTNLLQHIAITKSPVILSGFSAFQPMDVQLLQSLIIVPVIARDTVIGYLELHSLSSDLFTNQHSEHMQIFAAQAAVAIQNARAYKQGQELAALEERQRLARDLHDAVTQTLFTSSVMSEALLRADRSKPEKIWEHLNTLHILNRGAMAEMRTLLIELRPEYLLKLPLAAQLQQLLDSIRSRKQIDLQLIVNEEHGMPIPDDVQIVIYRITQEALNNIVKHAGATQVVVRLDNAPDHVQLSVTDNGFGFDIDEHAGSPGMGLANMEERARSIQAELLISSSVTKGTQISFDWLRNTEK